MIRAIQKLSGGISNFDYLHLFCHIRAKMGLASSMWVVEEIRIHGENHRLTLRSMATFSHATVFEPGQCSKITSC